MTNNILNKILIKKKENLIKYKKIYTEEQILNSIKKNKNFFDFKEKLKKRDLQGDLTIIGEIKQASPSAGKLVNNFDHLNIAKQYIDNGVKFLSVLTEEDFFLGNLIHISKIK